MVSIKGKEGEIWQTHSENGGKKEKKVPCTAMGRAMAERKEKAEKLKKWLRILSSVAAVIWSGTAGHPAGDNGLQLCKAQEEVGRKA